MQGDAILAEKVHCKKTFLRMRMSAVNYDFMHYYVRLEEGRPPKDYWASYSRPFNQHKMLEEWVSTHRERKPDLH